jgi:catechol 2,3-dioxygenase-like lactoylglutathione lyase family enzyme
MRAWAYVSAILAVLLVGLPAGATAAERPGSVDATITFFYYESIQDQVAFYEGLLGLSPSMVEDWVRIYPVTDTSSVGLVLEGRGFHPVSDDKPAMLSIVTGDVDAWYERMVNAGVPVRSPLRPPGTTGNPDDAPVRGFVVEDPGGYTIEFFTWQKNQ